MGMGRNAIFFVFQTHSICTKGWQHGSGRRPTLAELDLAFVEGSLKVLKHPDEKPILPGDILVTKATDPGWTTLFINTGGVLLEIGGALQHGASVAREMGKPCIVVIEDVTKILNDGQIVQMDGNTGIINILSKSA
jgi:pyruvate,water dikinase